MVLSLLQGLMYPFLFLSLYFQVLLLTSFFENKKRIKKEEHRTVGRYPTVTVAVPCWNEGATLAGTLDSLLALDYPHDKLKVIVVDNNSTDTTNLIASEYAARYPSLIEVQTETTQGKHNAVNRALRSSDSELFGCLDADSFVTPKTLTTIVSYFEADPNTMAVTPCIHIKQPRTLIQRMQAIEYLMGVFLRKAYGELDAIQVTPGPFSIFRRSVFSVIGEYNKAHNTEDFEITLRMHKHHLKIKNSHKALVYTVGPATAWGFFHQRLRWARGFLENALDYKELFFKKKYGNFGMFTLPMAFMFVFYGLYAALFFAYSVLSELGNWFEKWIVVGFHPRWPDFDLFYIDTSVLSFLVMVAFSMFLFVLYIGNTLSDDKQEFYHNFPMFFVLYPLFVPLFLARAVLDTLRNHKNEWILQDTKR